MEGDSGAVAPIDRSGAGPKIGCHQDEKSKTARDGFIGAVCKKAFRQTAATRSEKVAQSELTSL
jgi:hypothetical protein